MNRFHLVIICICLISLPPTALAQRVKKPKAPVETSARDKSVTNSEKARIARERREQARSLLISLASDARSFRDQPLRARSLARIGDALWDVDAEQGRTLFRRAWEAAEIGDRESQEPVNLRRQILSMMAKRDRLLANALLDKLQADQGDTAQDSEPDLWALSDALEQRLSLAASMLREGDTERAIQFADPVLGSVTISTLEFLTLLREKNPAAADHRYAAMLVSAGENISADANTISLLSSYIFTPHLYVMFNTEGVASSRSPGSFFSPAAVAPQLQLAFFQTAVGVLLRSQPQVEPDPDVAGITGKYMVIRRLMPLFEQFAPKELAEAMRAQFNALSSLMRDSVREENEWLTKGIIPEKQQLADQEQSLLDKIDHAKSSDERDEFYFKLALLAVTKDQLVARDYVSKIDESWLRKRAQAWIDWSLALNAIKKKAVERALELTRKGELTHIQRVWILTQSAKLLATKDRDKALLLLDEATDEARRIDGLDVDRPRGLFAIANALQVVEPTRAWDAIFDAVRAANSTEAFVGESGALTTTIRIKSQAMKKTEDNPDFEIKGIFGLLANKDFNRAVQLARGFQGDAPRANATIAICRAVLQEKIVSVPAAQPTVGKGAASPAVR